MQQQIAVADGQIAEREIQLGLLGATFDAPNVPVYPSRQVAEEALEGRENTADGKNHDEVLTSRKDGKYKHIAEDFVDWIDESNQT